MLIHCGSKVGLKCACIYKWLTSFGRNEDVWNILDNERSEESERGIGLEQRMCLYNYTVVYIPCPHRGGGGEEGSLVARHLLTSPQTLPGHGSGPW